MIRWRAREVVALLLVVGVALGLRLWNLSFGLPDWYHPDEPIKVRQIVHMAGGDLRPDSFYHPTFMLYAAAATLRVMHAGGAPVDEQTAIRAGRLTVALFGAATVLLTALAGRAVGGPFVGLAAAMLLAAAPLHVVCSHYLKEDVPMTFWAVATFLACLRIARRGDRRDCFLGGALAGVTAGTKYTGLLFVGFAWVAYREHARAAEQAARTSSTPTLRPNAALPRPGPGTRALLLAALVGFLVVTPYALLDLPRFLLGLGHGGANALTGMAGIAVSPLPYLWTFHMRHSILPGFGVLPTALALLGFVLALRRPEPAARLLTVIVAVWYTVFENSPYKPPPNADRHVVPMLPFLAILAAGALQQGFALFPRDPRSASLRARGGVRIAVAGLLMLSVVLSLTDSVRITAAMHSDTRQRARDWLLRHACGSERILLEGALNVSGRLVPSYVPALPDACRATYAYSLAREQERIDEYDVVVASSFMYERFLRFASAPADAKRFYSEFFASHQPIVEFGPAYRSYGFHDPTIRIYRLRRE